MINGFVYLVSSYTLYINDHLNYIWFMFCFTGISGFQHYIGFMFLAPLFISLSILYCIYVFGSLVYLALNITLDLWFWLLCLFGSQLYTGFIFLASLTHITLKMYAATKINLLRRLQCLFMFVYWKCSQLMK